jgi:hypothetical protein
VDARTFPSGLNAAAIVDLGAGTKEQYLADKCRSESASTLRIIFKDVSQEARIFLDIVYRLRLFKYHDNRPRFASLATCFVLGEISLRASKLKTLLRFNKFNTTDERNIMQKTNIQSI